MHFTASVLVAIASATAVRAQYAGNIFFKAGDCPSGTQAEHQLRYQYSASNGNLCIKQDFGSNNKFDAFTEGNIIGTDARTPKRFAGCPTAGCDSGCQDVDINAQTNGYRSPCGKFTDASYLYIGN